MKKHLFSLIIALSLVFSVLLGITAMADGEMVVTLGADLDETQRTAVLKYFGIYGQNVRTMYITNQDERAHLGYYVPLEQIGTHTYSCALVRPTNSGGIQVRTANLSWVTGNMIATTLSTSGVVNCEVLAAAPFEVSGTGALTGIIMAYENAVGTPLDSAKKDVATQELVTTGTIANSVGQSQATNLVNEIKIQIIEGQVEDPEEVVEIVDEIVEENVVVELSEEDRDLLIDLANRIAEQQYDYEDMRQTLERVEQNVNVNVNVDASSSNNNTNTSDNNNTSTNTNTDNSTTNNTNTDNSTTTNTNANENTSTAAGGDTSVNVTDASSQSLENSVDVTGTPETELPADSILNNQDISALEAISSGDVLVSSTTSPQEAEAVPVDEIQEQRSEAMPSENEAAQTSADEFGFVFNTTDTYNSQPQENSDQDTQNEPAGPVAPQTQEDTQAQQNTDDFGGIQWNETTWTDGQDGNNEVSGQEQNIESIDNSGQEQSVETTWGDGSEQNIETGEGDGANLNVEASDGGWNEQTFTDQPDNGENDTYSENQDQYDTTGEGGENGGNAENPEGTGEGQPDEYSEDGGNGESGENGENAGTAATELDAATQVKFIPATDETNANNFTTLVYEFAVDNLYLTGGNFVLQNAYSNELPALTLDLAAPDPNQARIVPMTEEEKQERGWSAGTKLVIYVGDTFANNPDSLYTANLTAGFTAMNMDGTQADYTLTDHSTAIQTGSQSDFTLQTTGLNQLTAGTWEPIAGRISYAEQGYENAILQSRDLGLEFSSYDFGYSEELGDYIADFTVTLNTPGLHWVDIIFYDAEGNAVTRTACITALQ